MLGAILGDMVGSVYEHHRIKTTDFPFFSADSRFTDDTVMTLAVAQWLMDDEAHSSEGLVACMQYLGRKYPYAGYGGTFRRWLITDHPQPYQSWGNGSAMRVSPVGLYACTLEETLRLAEISAAVSHDHPEGIKGAQAIAACVFLHAHQATASEIKSYITHTFGYDLNRTTDSIRPAYGFDVSCQGSVPEAIISFLEGGSLEDIIRRAVSLGGDADTLACMAGAIVAAGRSMPEVFVSECLKRLPSDLSDIVERFEAGSWYPSFQ